MIANISTNDLERNYNKAELELKALADLVVNGKEADIPKGILKTEFTSEFTRMSLKQLLKRHSITLRKGISSNVLYLIVVKLSSMVAC